MKLTEQEKKKIIKLIEAGKTLPAVYKSKLFDRDDTEFIEATKDYRLVYKGKARKEDIIAQTPAAPFQKILSFNLDNPFEDDWQNMLIFGDNLLALKTLYEDQRGENRYKTKNKIKLIYIDPPFATKQDFMKDREKAYRDKIIGAQFIEFLRKRLILMREILADDGSIYVHLDWKKGHYIKAIMDEVFGEHNFLGEIVWKKLTNPKKQSSFFGNVHDTIFSYQKGVVAFKYEPVYTDFSEKYIKTTYRYIESSSGRRYGSFDLTQAGQGPARNFGKYGSLNPPEGKHWIWGQNKIDLALKEDRIIFFSSGWPRVKKYLNEQGGKVASDLWDDLRNIQAHAKEDIGYPTQKPEQMIERIIKASSNENDIILDALTTVDFEHVREAIRKSIHFFVTDTYTSTEQAAVHTFNTSEKLQNRYRDLAEYLEHVRIKDKKSYSIDLATGTGKSWVIYGVAQIMLAEGLVYKVLVLCPSLTIEEELKKKFERFSGDAVLTKILEELGADYPSPAIKSANDPILNGDICVENIHAAYQRTGSSIEDSFKGKGARTLVISDEAHHIYSEADAAVKKWFGFLTNEEYGFQYLLGLSGTPYIGDEYFHDVIYRYGIKQAMDDGIVKKIDYKVEEESTKDKGFDETYQNHLDNQQKYSEKLKPITIVITDKIVTCIKVWNDLVKYISEKESISYEQAAKKVIWVTSGTPSNKNEKAVVESILEQPEKARKENLSLLKTVDDPDNPVEWIVSVSMLTEGWDVKNVFQIVPHEQRAFNSKLLISQVLGRGLRIPDRLSGSVFVKINNHEKWTSNIINLYNEVLEIENRFSWGYDENKSDLVFPLYNLEYSSVQDTTESKEKPAKEPDKVNFSPQSREWEETSLYSESGSFRFTVEMKHTVPLEQAAQEIKLFLKDKDQSVSRRWHISKIKEFIVSNLEKDGYDATFVSRENLSKAKQAFGPMLREIGRENPRMKMQPDSVIEVSVENMVPQFFNESSLKGNGYLFYCKDSPDSLPKEQQAMLYEFIEDKNNYSRVKEKIEKYGGSESEIRFLKDNLIEIDKNKFKTLLNLFYVSYEPERKFTRSLFNNIDLFDSVLKSPDKGFYWFPYSYKPDEKASTHVKRENFNPDFFQKMKTANEILVVEMKADGDTKQKNRAKYRDGKEHFEVLNVKLKDRKIDWKYYFYFLSPEDITEFFQAIKESRHKTWKSSLMQELA